MDNISSDILQFLKETREMLALENELEMDYSDKSQFRYALYARKSSEDENHQPMSVEHQIADCKERVIERYGIKNFDEDKDVFKEDKSAKKSGQRKEFNAMIKAIKKGQYNGIIAWHYDRLSRNMKEAGEIIDMVDNGQIKDLLFATSTFEHTPTGLMTLGVSFVLSKHYSDHLSENVLRGNNKRTEAGIVIVHMVHGYRISKDGKLIEDGENWELIRKAFRMRIDDHMTLTDIASFLNKSGYQAYYNNQKKGGEHRTYNTFRKQTVQNLFENRLYAGVYKYGGIAVPTEKCCAEEFRPMLTPQEYYEINQNIAMPGVQRSSSRKSNRDVSNFLRKLVQCSHCSHYMGTSVVNPKTRPTFRFRCENKDCPMCGSGPTGALVRDYVIDFLEKNLSVTETHYYQYIKDRENEMKKQKDELAKRKANLKREIRKNEEIYNNTRKKVSLGQDEEHFNVEFLNEQKNFLRQAKEELKEIEADLDDIDKAPITISEFLELYRNTGEILRLTSGMSLADEIIRIFFLNIKVEVTNIAEKSGQKQWSIVDHTLRSPFDKLFENAKSQSWSG